MSASVRSDKAKAAEGALTLLGGLFGIAIGVWVSAAGGPMWIGSAFALAGLVASVAGIAGLVGILIRASRD